MRTKIDSWMCSRCGGTGRVPAPGAMRQLRAQTDKSLREVAGLMHISPAYLSDLERGNRQWDADLIVLYREALGIEAPKMEGKK